LSRFDILIVGAGAAGLAAGRVLAAAGLRVAIVEARNRVGGRICTQHASVPGRGDLPVELGAEFIHGLPATSWNLIRDAGLDTRELDGSQLCFENSVLQHCGREQQQTFKVLAQMSRWLELQPLHTDVTFAQYLSANGIEAGAADRATAYVEGFNAADRDIIGIAGLARQQQAEDLIQGDRIFHVKGGYEGIPRFLCKEFIAQGGELLLDRPVSLIRWQTRTVVASGQNAAGKQFDLSADQLLSTLPLGVLQTGSVEFAPPLPELQRQVSRMSMGAVQRISLVFETPFWKDAAQLDSHSSLAGELQTLSFLLARGTHWPTWWTWAPDAAPVITAWAGGPTASRLDVQSLADQAVGDLARMFSLSPTAVRALLVSTHHHDWQTDPYSRGAYSYVSAGALQAPTIISRPCAETLFFAGEHTDLEGHWGTVHAALNSGLRAAAQLLQSRR